MEANPAPWIIGPMPPIRLDALPDAQCLLGAHESVHAWATDQVGFDYNPATEMYTDAVGIVYNAEQLEAHFMLTCAVEAQVRSSEFLKFLAGPNDQP